MQPKPDGRGDVMTIPALDGGFTPAAVWTAKFLENAEIPVSVAVERENGYVYKYETRIGSDRFANAFHMERLVKMLLWAAGGYRVYVSDAGMAGYIGSCYRTGGIREFDRDFMERVYERRFEVIHTDAVPETKGSPAAVKRSLAGNRIGFDAGGSDMKVSAVKDGEVIYSEEIVWRPKTNGNPEYHYGCIRDAIAKGAARLGGKIDAIGVSSAGIYVANRAMVASLFLEVPREDFETRIKDIYVNIAHEFGAPVTVANDGDVAALAGSICLKKNGVLGIAMGTSQAAGYVDDDGKITGWLNELAFAPVDYSADAERDEWSGDTGAGVKYFSQDAVARLAQKAGIELPEGLSPAEKLKYVQALNEGGHAGAARIFETIGVYFGYALAYYANFYGFSHVQVMGRVTSGAGGEAIIRMAREVLETGYPALAKRVTIYAPDEYERRVGQSIAAASL